MAATRLLVRTVSCDAKVIGSLVGGCRILIRDRETGATLAEGLQLGGSGDSDLIMKKPHTRYGEVYGAGDSASFLAELELEGPVELEIVAEGPLAFPQAMQRAVKTLLMVPGQHVQGEGLILILHGFIVDIMNPSSVETFTGGDKIALETSVRLL